MVEFPQRDKSNMTNHFSTRSSFLIVLIGCQVRGSGLGGCLLKCVQPLLRSHLGGGGVVFVELFDAVAGPV